jgi:DNA-binding winged helix-turn-helix (wHTH) protein
MQVPSPTGKIRFGVFEADFSIGDLRKRGRRVRLQEQPFKVLAVLLQHPGEVVTREQLRQALWPADTFVDFEDSLNKAVQKLRQSLGDSAEKPRYIETVARRGYRLIIPVDSGPQVAQDLPSQEPRPRETDAAITLSSKIVQRIPPTKLVWVGLLTAAITSTLAVWIRGTASVPYPVRRFTIAPEGEFANPVISPDGKQIAYISQIPPEQADKASGISPLSHLSVRDLRREEPREITATEGAYGPLFWSPDSAVVGFGMRKQLWKASVQRGLPSPICEVSDALLGGAWSQDGRTIIFSIHHQGIYEVPAGGGVPRMLVPVDRSAAGDHFDDPYLLPVRGRDFTLLYAAQRVGAIHDIVLHSLKSGKKSVLVQNAFLARRHP